MNKKRSQENQDRQARLAAIQAQQRAGERKRNALIFGGIGAVILAVIIAVTLVIVNQVQVNRDREAAASQPIEGIQEYPDVTFNHVDAAVEYEQSPPVGGDHNPVWTNCGVYTEPVPNENSVHSMEHGAVWITYDPEIGQEEIDKLTELVGTRSYVLLSPYPDLDTPIAASAWGLQLKVDSADDSRLATFLDKYIQGEQTREPGAACSGGITPAGRAS
ncbi:membrane protein [Arthrobacter sp. MN05-02]|nr:membrane protein [Arthrobacter sp. MN05-02]